LIGGVLRIFQKNFNFIVTFFINLLYYNFYINDILIEIKVITLSLLGIWAILFIFHKKVIKKSIPDAVAISSIHLKVLADECILVSYLHLLSETRLMRLD